MVFLYSFLTKNKSYEPRNIDFSQQISLNNIYVAAHTYDTFGKRISSYVFQKIRFIHIQNVGIWHFFTKVFTFLCKYVILNITVIIYPLLNNKEDTHAEKTNLWKELL